MIYEKNNSKSFVACKIDFNLLCNLVFMTTSTAPFLQRFEPALQKELLAAAQKKTVEEGAVLIRPGQYLKAIPLLVNGSIKILRTDAEGNELLLYYLDQGDTCAMSMSCYMGTSKSEILAVAETSSELLMIPLPQSEQWFTSYKSWRAFVLDSYHSRISEILETIDNIAFNNMDQRLEHYLNDKVHILKQQKVNTTHQEIAQELNTSRVVISRLLKKMEHLGKVKLHRNAIEVL